MGDQIFNWNDEFIPYYGELPNFKNMKTGIELIKEERQKQIDKHGFTAEHHVNHPEWYESDQLSRAAASILMPNKISLAPDNWDMVWFRNLKGREKKERLVIAGALIAAELDRLELLEK